MKTSIGLLFLLMVPFNFSGRIDAQTALPRENKAAHVPSFDDYPVEVWSGTPAQVIIKSRDERLYRTNLRNSVRQPPNFAGHYSFVHWGCGTNCLQGAVVDQQTGKVFQPPVTEDSNEAQHWDILGMFTFGKPPIRTRANSRLMVLRREYFSENRHEYMPEMFYFVWENEGFNLVLHTIAGRIVK